MTPHYLRFARSLALVSGLGCAAAGCGMATTPGDDSGTAAPDTGGAFTDVGLSADAGTTDDANPCATCTCGLTADDAGLPFCGGDLVITCGCAAVGPLAPPDLAV